MVDSTRIGTSDPKYFFGSSAVDKLYLGSSLVYSSRIEQVITVSTLFRSSSTSKTWDLTSATRPAIVSGLAGSSNRWLWSVGVQANGGVNLDFSTSSGGASQGRLSQAFEQSGGLTFTVGNNSVTVAASALTFRSSSGYHGVPSNSSEVTAFFSAIGTSNVTATITLFA